MKKIFSLLIITFLTLSSSGYANLWSKKPTTAVAAATPQPTPSLKKRVIIVPPEYKNDQVVVVNSEEYNALLANKKIADQLKKDYITLDKEKKAVDLELQKQAENKDKMVIAINELQKKNLHKTIIILVEGIIIAILAGILGLIVYMRFRANSNSLVGLKLF